MPRNCALFLVLVLSSIAYAQRSDGGGFSVSPTPSAVEIRAAFLSAIRGTLDPFLVIPEIASRGENAVDGLGEIVLAPFKIVDDTASRQCFYAVLCLEAIASTSAYDILFTASTTHNDLAVRARALIALASSFHKPESLEKFVPDTSLVHLMIQNVDDTTSIPFLQKRIGDVAREGLITWTGWDAGEPQGSASTAAFGKPPASYTLRQMRELWWQQIGGNLAWDSAAAQYPIQ